MPVYKYSRRQRGVSLKALRLRNSTTSVAYTTGSDIEPSEVEFCNLTDEQIPTRG